MLLSRMRTKHCFSVVAEGQGVEPAPCYRRVTGRFLWSACRSVLGQGTKPQTALDVLVGILHGNHCHECM